MACAACVEIRKLLGRDQVVIMPSAWVIEHDSDCPAREPIHCGPLKAFSYDPKPDEPRAAPLKPDIAE